MTLLFAHVLLAHVFYTYLALVACAMVVFVLVMRRASDDVSTDAAMRYVVDVYLTGGTVQCYDALDKGDAMRDAEYILKHGYRGRSDEGRCAFYPPHRISRVDIRTVDLG